MKTVLKTLLSTVVLFSLISCDDDDDNVTSSGESNFQSLSSPYLICATRNPGGVGFDFEYNGEIGGANYMDSLTVNDFDCDVLIKTIKAEKPDGSLGGMPYFTLTSDAEAINYSSVDTQCKGLTAYQNLQESELETFTFLQDNPTFDLSGLTTGNTGKPLMSEVQTEFAKLVIGQKWKASANNDIDGDELVWIVKTAEERLIKMIVTDFPADPAPTPTGYIALEWEFLN